MRWKALMTADCDVELHDGQMFHQLILWVIVEKSEYTPSLSLVSPLAALCFAVFKEHDPGSRDTDARLTLQRITSCKKASQSSLECCKKENHLCSNDFPSCFL